MRPRVKSTIVFSILGLSLAMNAALAIGLLRGVPEHNRAAAPAGSNYCLLDRLDLDNGQKRRLAAMRRRMHEKRSAYWQRATAIKVELAEAICAAPADHGLLEVQLARYAANQAEMQRAVADHLLGVNAMLRPAQRDAFRTLLRNEMFRGIRPSPDATTGAP